MSPDIGIENFGTEELNIIPLTDGTILTVTSTQEISAGCEDGRVSELKPRNQELNEIELDMGFMPLVMILLLALITSLGLKEMEIFKLILVIQIQE